MEQKMTLLIKTVFGRTLLDTRKTGLAFELAEVPEQEGGGWEFAVAGVDPELAGTIMQSAGLLNLFHFLEDEAGQLSKCWYYGIAEPIIAYGAEGGRLQVRVDSRMPYSNEKV